MRAMTQEQRRGAGVSRGGRWARFKGYLRDSHLELQKVIWPTREEVVKMTGLVIAVVCIVGLFIVAWDSILLRMTRHLFE